MTCHGRMFWLTRGGGLGRFDPRLSAVRQVFRGAAPGAHWGKAGLTGGPRFARSNSSTRTSRHGVAPHRNRSARGGRCAPQGALRHARFRSAAPNPFPHSVRADLLDQRPRRTATCGLVLSRDSPSSPPTRASLRSMLDCSRNGDDAVRPRSNTSAAPRPRRWAFRRLGRRLSFAPVEAPRALGSGRRRSSAAAQVGPEPDDCCVAFAIARCTPGPAIPFVAKHLSGRGARHDSCWAKPAANAIQKSACSTCKSWGAS